MRKPLPAKSQLEFFSKKNSESKRFREAKMRAFNKYDHRLVEPSMQQIPIYVESL